MQISIKKNIETIIKNKYNLLCLDVSNYSFEKFQQNLINYIVNKNNNFLMLSDNKELITIITTVNKLPMAKYALFYKEDFLTFNESNYKDIIEGQALKKILNIEKDADYDMCVICLEKNKSGLRCVKNCGNFSCLDCLNQTIVNNHYNCGICRSNL